MVMLQQNTLSEPVWYPLPQGGSIFNSIFPCVSFQQIVIDSSGGGHFVVLPGSFNIARSSSKPLYLYVMVCNYNDPLITLAIETYDSDTKPCIIIPTQATSTSLKLIPFGC